MSARRDGGQAFPVPPDEGSFRIFGMSLRQHWAGKALEGFCVNSDVDLNPKVAAKTAFEIADAMLDADKEIDAVGASASLMLRALLEIRDLGETLIQGPAIWKIVEGPIAAAQRAGVRPGEKGEVGP